VAPPQEAMLRVVEKRNKGEHGGGAGEAGEDEAERA
jgi:hypothetical protein